MTIRNVTLALYGLVLAFLMAAGVAMAQSPSTSPTPSPSASVQTPSAAPSTGGG